MAAQRLTSAQSPARAPLLETEDDEPQRSATVASCILNLANTILGAGTLGIPSAFALCGSGLGSGLLALFAMLSAFGLHLLSSSAQIIEEKKRAAGETPGPATFRSVASAAAPRFSTIIDLAVAVKCFGVATSYLIVGRPSGTTKSRGVDCGTAAARRRGTAAGSLAGPSRRRRGRKRRPQVIGDVMPVVAKEFLGSKAAVLTRREPWIVLAAALVTPLALKKKLDALRIISACSLACCAGITVLIFTIAVQSPAQWDDDAGVALVSFNMQTLQNLPVFIFAYFRRVDHPLMNRGDAAAGTWTFRGDEERRGWDVDIPWRRGTPRLGRGHSVETRNAAAGTWIFRGGSSRLGRGARLRYTCQQNIFAVNNEIRRPTRARVDKVIVTSIVSALCVLSRRVDIPRTGRGDAVTTTRIFRGDEARRRRGRDAENFGSRLGLPRRRQRRLPDLRR